MAKINPKISFLAIQIALFMPELHIWADGAEHQHCATLNTISYMRIRFFFPNYSKIEKFRFFFKKQEKRDSGKLEKNVFCKKCVAPPLARVRHVFCKKRVAPLG